MAAPPLYLLHALPAYILFRKGLLTPLRATAANFRHGYFRMRRTKGYALTLDNPTAISRGSRSLPPSNGLSFTRRLWYNICMKLEKIQPAAMPAEETFTFDGGTVQGASVGKTENCLFVRSARRYKLFTEGTDELLFLEGNGHFKWARGEKDFAAGDCFRIEAPGEYEVNGKCVFIVRRS